MPKTYFGQLGAGSPGDFWGGSRAGSCLGVALAAWAVSSGQALILAASIYPKEELQQRQPAAPGSSSLFTQLLEFLLGAEGLQGRCPGLLGPAAVVALPSSLREFGTVWDPWE